MSRKAGYSLFEVLVAFAIMTLVLSVLLAGQSQLLRRVNTADEHTLATDYAVSLANLAAATPPDQWRDTRFPYRNWQIEQSVHQNGENQYRMITRVISKDGVELALIGSLGTIQ